MGFGAVERISSLSLPDRGIQRACSACSHRSRLRAVDGRFWPSGGLRAIFRDRPLRLSLRLLHERTHDLPATRPVLTLEELATLGRAFVELGVRKIRITGGEPLVRCNVLWLFQELGRLRERGLAELVLTTNGSQLERLAADLKAAGVARLNISLDSLKPERFRRITRTGELDGVLRGIRAAQAAGFQRLKLNAVILKHRNHDEVVDLVRFAIDQGLDISFIEEMPLGEIGDHDRAEMYYSSDAIRADLAKVFSDADHRKYRRSITLLPRAGNRQPHRFHFPAQP